jgi:hypothetical protein
MGNIGEGTVLNPPVLAIRLTQQDSGRGASIGDDSDVHVDKMAQFTRPYKPIVGNYMTIIE